jgi:ATP-dependent RNA/DNA helicase IGHMBP2
MNTPRAIERFVERQLRLLELERQAEIDETVRLARELPEDELERRGVMLRRLVVADLEPGLGGRTMAILESSRGGALPAHRFGPGDVVALRSQRSEAKAETSRDDASGVVAAVRFDRIVVALDDEDAELPPLVRLDRVAPDVTFRRMVAALKALPGEFRGPAKSIRAFVFGGDDRARELPSERPASRGLVWFDANLDDSQRDAVSFALDAAPVALIHGPPGTGKTTAIVELIRQATKRGERVLACAPSNVAVDNVVERLARAGVRVVRLGHPARLLPSVREHSLDALVEAASDPKVYRDLRRDLQVLQRKLQNARDKAARLDARTELRALRDEQRRMEDATIRGILDMAEVVATTLTGAADPLVARRDHDLVVIDEAAQAIEAACWIALLRGKRAVLAGDHCQLPPTVVSQEAAREGLGETLFERVTETLHGAERTRMLTVQYRMNETIMRWASDAMYGGHLTAAALVKEHRLCDLPGVTTTRETETVMLLIDTAGCGLEESVGDADGSKSNEGEARIVVQHVEALLEAGLRPADIGVITPYNAQVQLLREALAAYRRVGEGALDAAEYENGRLEIDTVDGFQGREKEAIVLSLVRSNDEGNVGFLAESRRLNVAVTRARRHVAIVADSATLARDVFLAGLIEYAQTAGEYRSAWEMLG